MDPETMRIVKECAGAYGATVELVTMRKDLVLDMIVVSGLYPYTQMDMFASSVQKRLSFNDVLKVRAFGIVILI